MMISQFFIFLIYAPMHTNPQFAATASQGQLLKAYTQPLKTSAAMKELIHVCWGSVSSASQPLDPAVSNRVQATNL